MSGIRSVNLAFSVLVVALAVFMETAGAQSCITGVLGKGTDWQVTYHIKDSGIEGPTVLVVGGIHGNEWGGWLAAEQIRHWSVDCGKLVVIPQVNRLGLKASMRWFPPTRNDSKLRDLNRNFPTQSRKQAVTDIAKDIWAFVVQQQPDWVFDLHEGFDFHRINSKSVGSSVISFPSQRAFAKELVDVVNHSLPDRRKFDLLAGAGPVEGSLARACGERLKAKSFILETTFKDQPLSTRTRQHRQMVSHALVKIGMLGESRVEQLVKNTSEKIEVGLFDGPGASAKRILPILHQFEELQVVPLGPDDIRKVSLDQFDVLLFPGGSGSKQGKALGQEGRIRVREFAANRGGIVGICAGAYLCSSHYNWSLDLMNAKVFNTVVNVPGKGRKSMWYRGPVADVDVEIHPAGKSVLGLTGLHQVRYANGPIISPGNKPNVPPYKVLATFRSENGIYEAQKGTMVGKPAVLYSKFGDGKVLALSPHFEFTRGKEKVILEAIESVVGR